MISKRSIPSILLCLAFSHTLLCQDSILENYRWSKRVLVAVCSGNDLLLCHEQIEEFDQFKNELIERKLILVISDRHRYQVLDTLSIDTDADGWITDSSIYDQYRNQESTFNVALIGLDGGIKLNQTHILSSKELFRIIDSMPMRRAELRRKNERN